MLLDFSIDISYLLTTSQVVIRLQPPHVIFIVEFPPIRSTELIIRLSAHEQL